MIALKIIIALVAIRSVALTFTYCRWYITVSTRTVAAFLATLLMIGADLFIICAAVKFFIDGGF